MAPLPRVGSDSGRRDRDDRGPGGLPLLLQAPSDPDAREAMLGFFKTTGFLPLDDEALAAMARLGRGVQRVRMEVE